MYEEIVKAKAAKETDILYHQDATVRWRFRYRGFWQLTFMVFFVPAFAYLFFQSQPPVPTPFIGSMVDLLDLKSRWVIPDLVELGYMFFVLSALFILALTYLLYQLFYSAVLSRIEEEEVVLDAGIAGVKPVKVEHGFTRIFELKRIGVLPIPINLQKNNWRRLFWYSTFLLFAVMLVSNTILFTYFFRLLRNPEMDLTGGLFSTIYLLAIISRLLCLFLSVSTLIQFVYHDFAVRVGKFSADFLPYFYPTIISVGIIALVFSKLAQFDAFFIELVQSPGNLILFSLFLFPVSLVIIWYGPVYSFFTDQKFAHRADSWNVAETHLRGKTSWFSRLGIFGWLVLHERLYGVKPAEVDPIEPPQYYLPLQNAKVPPPSITFFSVGRLLGVFYVFSLISICTSIYLGNNSALAPFSSFVPLVVLGLVLSYWVYIQKSFSRARHPDNLADRIVGKKRPSDAKSWPWWYNLQDREDDKPKDTKIYYVDRKWTFWLGLVSVGFSLLFFLLTLWKSIAGAAWEVVFGYFLCFLLVSIFSFVWLVMYSNFYERFTFDAGMRKTDPDHAVTGIGENKSMSEVQCEEDNHGVVSRWDKALDFLGYSSTQMMLIFIWLVGGGFLLFFFYGLFSGKFLSSSFLQHLNPLNIYLLLINGFIALLLIVGRFLLLRDLSLQHAFYSQPGNMKSKYDTISVMNFFRGVAVVALVLGLAYYGNSYHEVSYRAEMKDNDKMSLVDYTTEFLDRLEAKPGDKEPILLVAADGGGLKACYWTMLQLYQLDSMGLFDDNVFMLSGASGGNMGLSMYTYLKGQQKPLSEIRAAIEEIGTTNFLSGDFTGLITRFPVNFIPNLPGWGARDLEDRAEGMARAYFNIVGGKTGAYAYDQVREQPYAYLWQEVGYDLPLFFSNTTRAEDGMRGVIHPLSNTDLTPGMVDLTARGSEAISFPDAAFLANRFPIMSPAGRIEGRGHFVDAGNADNSGISSIMHVLNYMKANSAVSPGYPGDTVYQRFFDDHPVIMIGVRNASNRFVRDQFLTQKDLLNRNFYRSELSANSNAAINSGLAGVPNSWDDYLRSDVPKKLGLVNDYHVLNLPFRLNEAEVHLALGGELDDPTLSEKVRAINRRVHAALGCAEGDGCFAVAPPLGRLMARPSVEYMRLMVRYPDNLRVFNKLK